MIHSLLCTRVLLHIRANDKTQSEEIATAQVSLDFAENSLASSTDQSDPEMAAESSGNAGASARCIACATTDDVLPTEMPLLSVGSEHLDCMDINSPADRGENELEKQCKEDELRTMQF